jgi:P-type Cu2+ transporter
MARWSRQILTMARPEAQPLSTPVQSSCYHCGEPVPSGVDLVVEIASEFQPMCCPGCQAVAGLIAGSGMDAFYQQRTAYALRPEADSPGENEKYAIYDDAVFLEEFTSQDPDGLTRTRLLIGGMTCAACTWLIEQSLKNLEGVEQAAVNLQQSRLDIAYRHDALPLSQLYARVESLGYTARPFQTSVQRQQMAHDYRQGLRRLAVAGIGMMQVGMFAVALHAGDIQGIAEQYQQLLRWVSLAVASFVVLFSARPFFQSAWRHLQAGALVMDLPVALAIGLAWLASLWATVSGSGQVYFDSVVMFTFFLLLGRFLEQRIRHRHTTSWFDAESTLPVAVSRFTDGQWLTVPRKQLTRDDIILVKTGETVPVDAEIVSGPSEVQEDTFNGESLPRQVTAGDTIYAGTLNVQHNVEARVMGSYLDTRLAALQRSVELAQTEKPALAQLADQISGWFVGAVLIITSATALIWYQIDPTQTLWISLSVLVISCPCALALATPAALTSAASALRNAGVIVRGENALDSLARTTHLVFDKTGTLTRGKLHIRQVKLLSDSSETQVLAWAAAMQHYSSHPVAQAFRDIEASRDISAVHYTLGAGLEGTLGGVPIRLGSGQFCRELAPHLPAPPDDEHYWIALCSASQALAWIGLQDELRPEAHTLIEQAHAAGLELELLTGDSSSQGPLLAKTLGIATVHTGQQPQQKMQRVHQLQGEGHIVTMVGDGLNDAPVLSLANASFAVASATDLARTQADFVLAGEDLLGVMRTVKTARACRRVMIQNLCWALTYNICAIPAAALGYIPPWAAAIGMSLSSLLVVLNSLRLNRSRQD